MNTNAEHTYPEDLTDKEISERVKGHLENLEHHNYQSNQVFQLYPQVTLGLTELQKRSAERALRASRNLSKTAIVLSLGAILFSGIVAWSTSRIADEWRLDQLSILTDINHHVSTMASGAARQ